MFEIGDQVILKQAVPGIGDRSGSMFPVGTACRIVNVLRTVRRPWYVVKTHRGTAVALAECLEFNPAKGAAKQLAA